MPFLNKLFSKAKKKEKKIAETQIKPVLAEQKKIATPAVFSKSDILLAPINTEKAMSGQSIGRYVFKVSPNANKIEISKAIGKAYNVKAVSVNIINVPRKIRQVGKTKGFKSGYKKAIITLAKGQTIEVQPQ